LVIKFFVYYNCIDFNRIIHYRKKIFMIPTNSSNSTNGCDSISSNCVIWQGPDISCINLCNGDTISDVTAKLAELVCDLITDGVTANPNLTGLDLSCLNIPGTTPTTLVPVLQQMVNAICADNAPSSTYTLPIMTLPACLVYNDPSGNPVTQLPLDQFATLIANKVCNILTSIATINTTLSNYNTRITVLENCVLPCSGAVVEKKVVPTCIINVGTLTDVSVLLLALEVRYCSLETAVGLPAAINSAISQADILSTTPTLSNPSVTYGGITGWVNTPVNLAQSAQNIWTVLNDLHMAVSSIQTNCCPSGCDSVTFGYNTSNVLSGTGVISGINFNFQNTTGTGSVIPATFNDCAGSTIITIKDVNNVTVTSTVSVAALQNSASGVTISLPGLNTYGALTTSVAFCVTDGRDTCNNTIVKSVAGVIPCPMPSMSSITSTGATVTFTNPLGTGVVYIIDIINSSTNVVVATYTQNSPGVTVTNAFTGLVAGTEYKTRVTVQAGGQTQVCTTNIVTFTTQSAAAACSNGLDVVFLLDYTSSMGSAINTIKAGIASTISTIQTESGTNAYRLALVLADEASTSTTTYSTSVDYLALPGPTTSVPQRIVNTGIGGKYQYITAVEKFATNNSTSFTTQLNKIYNGTDVQGGPAPTYWPIGSGVGGPEPTDMALGFVVESNAFAGTFRTGVAKYVLIYTDNFPSGNDDAFNDTDVARLNSLAQTCLTQGIKCFVLGPGTSLTYTPSGGTLIYPWRNFAIATGGAWNVSYATATVNSLITNGCSSTYI
jgi:hypothetical protein